MKNNLWVEVERIISKNSDTDSYECVISLMIPYIKVCSREYQKKANNFNLSIPFEDFFSNALFEVWEGLKAYQNDNKLNIKNIILFRLNLSEKKLGDNIKKRGTPLIKIKLRIIMHDGMN